MRGSVYVKFKRIAASIMGVIMLVAMLFPSLYVAVEADHECIGYDCPVCACIQQCRNTLNQIGAAVVSAYISAPLVVFLLLLPDFFGGVVQETLVSKKVRLNN